MHILYQTLMRHSSFSFSFGFWIPPSWVTPIDALGSVHSRRGQTGLLHIRLRVLTPVLSLWLKELLFLCRVPCGWIWESGLWKREGRKQCLVFSTFKSLLKALVRKLFSIFNQTRKSRKPPLPRYLVLWFCKKTSHSFVFPKRWLLIYGSFGKCL